MRNDDSNDINHDLSKDFMNMSLFLNIKKTVKKSYLEVCKMEKEKSLELEKNGVFSELQKVTSLTLVAQADLQGQFKDEDGTVVRMALDAETFGSLEWVIQYIYLNNGKQYKRLISKHGATQFTCVYPMPVIGGQK